MTRNGSLYELVFRPVPDKAYPVAVTAVLRPARSATQVDDDLFDRWVEPIIVGAEATLRAIPDQPFSDIQLGAARSAQFRAMANAARVEGGFNRVITTRSVRPRPAA